MSAASKPSQAYKGNGQHDWEPVLPPSTDFVQVRRLRVPGGWLYGTDDEGTMTFVPMPEVVKHKV